jgi:LPXTG-motif cell wall-anchored protein
VERRLLIIVSFGLGLSFAAAGASSDEAARAIRIETRVSADSVTVGQRLHVNYTAAYPDSLTLLPPEQFDAGNCRLVLSEWRDARKDAKEGGTIREANVVVLPMDLQSASIPPAPFFFLEPDGDTLVAFAEEVNVPIRQVTDAQSRPKPLKPQWKAPRSYFYYLLAGGLLLLAAIALWLWKRRKKTPVVEVPRPELPADYVALKALTEIDGMNLLEKGQYKRFYTLVVDTLRHYMERRFGIQAMDRTTDEILVGLQERRLQVNDLERLLREADLVKFAKYLPEITVGKRALDTARDIVVRTTPRPVAAAGGE